MQEIILCDFVVNPLKDIKAKMLVNTLLFVHAGFLDLFLIVS